RSFPTQLHQRPLSGKLTLPQHGGIRNSTPEKERSRHGPPAGVRTHQLAPHSGGPFCLLSSPCGESRSPSPAGPFLITYRSPSNPANTWASSVRTAPASPHSSV